MRAPITLGLQLPLFDFPGVGPGELFETLAGIATTAEESGFDSLFVMDHLHQIAVIGPPEWNMLEGNVILAGLAARTSRLNLGLLVGGVTYRNPALLAKTTTTLDIVSGGRAILGIGAAWNEEEHRAYGYDFPPLGERFERLEDALAICRALFTSSPASHEGRHYRIDGAFNNPQPVRGDIPIMIGGSGERKTLRFVARHADACNLFGDAETMRHKLAVLDGHCEAEGRDPAEITRTRLGTLIVAPTHEEAERRFRQMAEEVGAPPEALGPRVTWGSPEEVAEQAQALLDAGLEGLIFNMRDAHDLESVALAGRTLAPVVHGGGARGAA